VAMMLVDESFRSRGIGRCLMKHALDELDSKGARTIRLDATSLGRPLYESLDFRAEATFARYVGVLPPADGPPELPVSPSSEVVDGVAKFDLQVTGTDRGRLLRVLIEEHPESLQLAIESGEIAGFLLSRPGSRARRIGPCLASEQAAPLLLGDVRRRYATEKITMDIPVDNAAAMALAASWGLNMTGLLTRMSRGLPVREDLQKLWASAGPEKG
jgi:Acetyltransferase (GNAT) domain